MLYVIDIETNGLLEDLLTYKTFPYVLNDNAKLWCVVITNVETKKSVYAVKENITREWLQESLKDCTVLIAHNGIKFDFLVLQLFGLLDYNIGYIDKTDTLFGREITFVDTLVWSRLFNPDRLGGHSLDSWGERIGNKKIDYRQVLIDNNLLDKSAPKGYEFTFYTDFMLEYCIQDTLTNVDAYLQLRKEYNKYNKWVNPVKVENKLADIGIRRETLGFDFNKPLAIENLKFLTTKMDALTEEVNKHLPRRKRNKGEIKEFMPPKIQVNKNGSLSAVMTKFIDKVGANYFTMNEEHYITFDKETYKLPYHEPLIKDIVTTIDNLDAIKMYLITLGWTPTSWKERDLTKDSKKQNLSYKKRVEALHRWFEETIAGKYKSERLEATGLNENNLLAVYEEKLREDRPVRVYTSPNVRVGVDKELCPNLTKLGDKVSFANEFVLYLTYKHRKNSIAGGEIEDMDFDTDSPNTGYLSCYREEDGRIGTPAIEIGASCVTADTLLTTTKGLKTIIDVSIGDLVLTHEGNYKEVIDKIDNGIKPVWEVKLENKLSLRCTGNHPFYTDKGWVMCQDLKSNELIYTYELYNQYSLFEDYTYKIPFKLSRLKSITYIAELPTYDITVKDNHSYVANGIVTHNTTRYKHIGVANIPRASSIFGKEMRSLFGCGKDAYQLGFDFASLEARIQGHYIMPYEGGKELAITLLAEKPNDVHCYSEDTEILTQYGWKSFGALEEDDLVGQFNDGIEFVKPLDIIWKNYSGTMISLKHKYIDQLVTPNHNIVLFKNGKYRLVEAKRIHRPIYRKYKIIHVDQQEDLCQVLLTDIVKSKVHYEGKIGCVTVPSGMIVVKRNDTIYISGNSVTAKQLGISRNDAKSVNYAILYGAAPPKLAKMLNLTKKESVEMYDTYWASKPSMKQLKEKVEGFWNSTNKVYIPSIDGRKILIRSQHSLLNALFQSAGVVCAKYVTVFMFEEFEKLGYCIDVFKGKPDVASMIEYHDEVQLYVNPTLIENVYFDAEKEAKDYLKTIEQDYQYSAIAHDESNDKYYITLPNIVSKTIQKGITLTEERLKLKVNLGYEWIVNKDWYGCH